MFSRDAQRSAPLRVAAKHFVSRSPDRDTRPTEGLTSSSPPFQNFFPPPSIFLVLLVDHVQEQMYSTCVAGAAVLIGTERGGVFLFSFYAGCRTKREMMRALRTDRANGRSCDGSGCRRRSSSEAFLTSRPGGTSGRLTKTKTPALRLSLVPRIGNVSASGVAVGRSR